MECESKEARIQLVLNSSKMANLKRSKQLLWPLMSLNQPLEEEYKEHLHALKKQQIVKNYQQLKNLHFQNGF